MDERKIINKNGVTLIALIITVIVLLILAGVSMIALLGDDSIFNHANNSKIAQEDGEAKEQIQLAWMGRKTKFYEDLSDGKTSFSQIEDYFEKDDLNALLSGIGGEITSLEYKGDGTFDISYKSSKNINYTGVISQEGDIKSFERTN